MKYCLSPACIICCFFAFSQDYPYVSIDPTLLENANAVVRLDVMQVNLIDHKTMTVSATRVVTVLNEEGEEDINAYQFYDKQTKIKELTATVYDQNGNPLEKFRERDFLDVSATGGNMYSDDRVKYLDHTPVSYPYTVELIREYQTSDTGFLPPWNFLDGFNVSTEASSFSISFAPGMAFRVKEKNLEEFGVTAEKGDDKLQYAAKNLKAIKYEPYAPSFTKIAPKVSFALDKFHLKGVDGYAKTWEEFGAWVHNSLLVGQDELDETTKRKVRELVKGTSNKREIVKRVYNYVQDNTRYISVQLGIGGWQPISALEVDRVKYGDCKGLTNYTKALLNEVGVDSYYTVIYGSRRKRDIDPDFPCLQGNHAVLNIPLGEEDIWLECTSQDTPVDYSALFTDDRYALRVTPNGGEIVRTKNYTPEDSKQFTKASVDIDGSGNISATVTIESTGIQYNQKYDLPSMTEKEQLDFYKEYWDYVNNLQIEHMAYDNDKETVRFTESVKVATADYISLAGENLLLAPNMFNRNLNVPKRIRDRRFNVVVSRGYLDEDEFTITLPKNMTVETLPAPVDLKNEFGEYQTTIEKLGDDQIKYTRRLLLRANEYDKSKYKAFREFKKKVARSDNTKIVLTKS